MSPKLLSNAGLAAHCSKANTQEMSAGRKGKLALFKRPATWGEHRLMSKNQLPDADQGARAFKGEFQGCTGGGGGYVQNRTVSSDSRLEIGCVVV